MIDKNAKALRRAKNISKAKRKRNICVQVYGFDWYNNLHEYSKNKIHCSCRLCACKTNNRLKCIGPTKNLSLMDRKTKDRMDYDETTL